MFTDEKVKKILGVYGDVLAVNKDYIFSNMKKLKSFLLLKQKPLRFL